jgi:hypothetical protein
VGYLLTVVSEPAGIPGMRSERRSQEHARTYDDQVAQTGWEKAREHDEAQPQQPGNDQPPPRGSSAMAVEVRARSAAKLGFA